MDVSVGMSRKWQAYEAGKEVARDTIKNLEDLPSFFLLFSTIHYEKFGGFQELLKGIWEVLPKDTPLVGGTIAGFINGNGCYTRGTTALAVSYPNMDVAISIGKNTKRNPRKAARECALIINEKLKTSQYRNKFLFTLVSSGLVPQIPGLGRTMIIPSKFMGKLAHTLLGFSGKILQKGVCRQDEVLKQLIKELPEYSLIHGGSTDDISQLKNYQFFNKNVYSNSLCALGLCIDIPINVKTTHGLAETNRNFTITSLDRSRRLIKSINGEPAIGKLFEMLHLEKEDLNEHIFSKIFFLPIGFHSKDGNLIPTVVGIFLGDSFYVIFQIEKSEGTVLNLSGQGLLTSIDESLLTANNSTKFALFSSCGMRLLALRNNTYAVHEKIKEKFKDTPFLLYYVAGEGTYSKNNGFHYGNYTFNSAFFG